MKKFNLSNLNLELKGFTIFKKNEKFFSKPGKDLLLLKAEFIIYQDNNKENICTLNLNLDAEQDKSNLEIKVVDTEENLDYFYNELREQIGHFSSFLHKDLIRIMEEAANKLRDA